MRKSLLMIAVGILSISILTGCANNSAKESTSEKVVDTTEASESVSNETKVSEEEADSTAESEKEDALAISYPYTYMDEAGREVTIEQEPKAIVVDYLPLWESLILLGVEPLAVSGADNYIATWDAFEGYDVSGVKDLGAKEVNLELLAELQPDIILSQSYDISNVAVENLEKVAPVAVFGPKAKMDWRLNLREVAKVVNKQAKAEEVIAEIDEKLASEREKLAAKYEGQTVVQFSLMGEDKYFVAYRPDLYDKETGLGLNVPEGFTTSENYEQISMEAIVQMNPDYIFVNVFDGDEALLEALEENSVWKSLKAVQNGHVYRLDGGGHAPSGLATLYTVNFITEALTTEK